MKNEDTQL